MEPKNGAKIGGKRLWERVLIWALPLLVSLIELGFNLTFRKRWVGRERFEALTQKDPRFILGIWHTNVLYSPLFLRGRNIAVMVSNSKDGEYITRVVERFGNCTVRGSSTRGGGLAMRHALTVLRAGGAVAITPDGPTGPVYKVKPGIATMAQSTGAPVVPFHYEADRQWLLRSWDQHRLPKPFANIVLRFGDPIFVTPEYANDPLAFAQVIEDAMKENMRICQQMVAQRGFVG